MFGIDNLKRAVGFGLNLTEEIQQATADGFQWTDVFGLVDNLLQVPGLIADGKQIAIELKDLNEEEKNDLVVYAQAEFNIPDQYVETIVEDALNLAFTTIAMVNKWRTIKAQN